MSLRRWFTFVHARIHVHMQRGADSRRNSSQGIGVYDAPDPSRVANGDLVPELGDEVVVESVAFLQYDFVSA